MHFVTVQLALDPEGHWRHRSSPGSTLEPDCPQLPGVMPARHSSARTRTSAPSEHGEPSFAWNETDFSLAMERAPRGFIAGHDARTRFGCSPSPAVKEYRGPLFPDHQSELVYLPGSWLQQRSSSSRAAVPCPPRSPVPPQRMLSLVRLVRGPRASSTTA